MSEKNLDLSEIMSQLPDVSLYKNRSIIISEGVTSVVAKKVVSQLLSLDGDNHKPITIIINSPGGEVNSGFAIYDTIRFLSSETRIIASGLCASIATVIFCAPKKQHRYSMPNAKFLIHQPLIPGQVYGQASDLEITAREILKTRQRINELLSKECSQPLDKVEADTTRDYWMSAAEAKEYGLVTKIVENVKELG